MRVAVSGDRRWTDRGSIYRALVTLDPDDFVILGDARGADALAREVCEELGLSYRVFRADWRLGRGAGPVRNRAMLVDGEAEELWYFHADLARSKGTANCVEQARRLGLVVRNGTRLTEDEDPSRLF